MNSLHKLRFALAALTATITCAVANADQPTDTPQWIQPGFDRLIPTSYPVVQPNFAKLRTASASQLSHPVFDRLIPTTYPLVLPNVSRLKVMTYEVVTPGTPQLHPETKTVHGIKNSPM
jgi:hypothetical protein